jgi:hypothetical protein
VEKIHHVAAIAEVVGVDRPRVASEVSNDAGDVVGDRSVESEQVCDREMAEIGAVPPCEEEIGDAGGLAGVRLGDGEKPVERCNGRLLGVRLRMPAEAQEVIGTHAQRGVRIVGTDQVAEKFAGGILRFRAFLGIDRGGLWHVGSPRQECISETGAARPATASAEAGAFRGVGGRRRRGEDQRAVATAVVGDGVDRALVPLEMVEQPVRAGRDGHGGVVGGRESEGPAQLAGVVP